MQTPITTEEELQRDPDRSDSGKVGDADHPRQATWGAPAAEQSDEPRAGDEKQRVADEQAGHVPDHDRATSPR